MSAAFSPEREVLKLHGDGVEDRWQSLTIQTAGHVRGRAASHGTVAVCTRTITHPNTKTRANLSAFLRSCSRGTPRSRSVWTGPTAAREGAAEHAQCSSFPPVVGSAELPRDLYLLVAASGVPPPSPPSARSGGARGDLSTRIRSL